MITGTVIPGREAVIEVVVRGAAASEARVRATVDTGFNDYLTLPPETIARLGLSYRTSTTGILADGRSVTVGVYLARVLWDGRERGILVLEAGGAPLVGMGLLYGSRLVVDVVDGGNVTIEALP